MRLRRIRMGFGARARAHAAGHRALPAHLRGSPVGTRGTES